MVSPKYISNVCNIRCYYIYYGMVFLFTTAGYILRITKKKEFILQSINNPYFPVFGLSDWIKQFIL